MPQPNMLPVAAVEVADEVIFDAVAGTGHCPSCGTASRKSVFVDGDTERCGGCGEELWFELRGDSVIAHKARQASQGSSLSELLRHKQLR